MKCPICEVDLNMTDRQGVEIDYCPKCRGIWLDRGELDKIIEKSQLESTPEISGARESQTIFRGESDHYDHKSHEGHNSGYGRHKKKGLLGDIFDF